MFISGRSKEIINRGGETISPFEIEEAVVQHPSVKEIIAFSAPHEQFQETVGAAIVTRSGQQRPDLPSLHKFLEDKLHRSKWPQVLVFMDALPKNAAGKLLRIRMAERMEMFPIDEESSPFSRLFDAKCPPVGSPLNFKIELNPVSCDLAATEHLLMQQTRMVLKSAVVKVDLPFHLDAFVAFVILAPNAEKTATLVRNSHTATSPTGEGVKGGSSSSKKSPGGILSSRDLVTDVLLKICEGNTKNIVIISSTNFALHCIYE